MRWTRRTQCFVALMLNVFVMLYIGLVELVQVRDHRVTVPLSSGPFDRPYYRPTDNGVLRQQLVTVTKTENAASGNSIRAYGKRKQGQENGFTRKSRESNGERPLALALSIDSKDARRYVDLRHASALPEPRTVDPNVQGASKERTDDNKNNAMQRYLQLLKAIEEVDIDNDLDISIFDDHIVLRKPDARDVPTSNLTVLYSDGQGNTAGRTSSQATNVDASNSDISSDPCDTSNISAGLWNSTSPVVCETSEYRQFVWKQLYRRQSKEVPVNCSAIVYNNDLNEVETARDIMFNNPLRIAASYTFKRSLNCNKFKKDRGYILHPLSPMEAEFPLAFSMIVYRDVEQIERLLRSIYRPHNYYCIHLDLKSDIVDRKVLENVVNCFENVFLSRVSVNVTWGAFSVLSSELLCMQELWKHKNWRYLINLTGQEFPLKTNREIVAILKSFDGANIVDGTWIRARQRYFYRWTKAKKPPPHKIRPIKGSVHIAVNREFVDFALHDQRSIDFLQWLELTEIPDETFFASLNHNPHLGINGSFLGDPEEYPLKPSLTRYKNWQPGHATFNRGCSGKFVRGICVLGIGDINRAYTDIGLFANKFHLDFEYLALDCLEKVLYEKTWRQYLENEMIDTSYYEHLDYTKKKLFVSQSNYTRVPSY